MTVFDIQKGNFAVILFLVRSEKRIARAVRAWGHAHGAQKHLAEIGGGVKTYVRGDLGHGLIGIDEQRLRVFDAHVIEVFDG